MPQSVYDFEVETLTGQRAKLDAYKGKVLLIVNTASKCGLTPQFAGLESLYEKHRAEGLEILGFPCNQFARQDPGSNEEIGEFCTKNYGVSFPMHAKIDVNGGDTHPLYAYLKNQAKGLLGSEAIKWNFTKFLIDRDGKVVRRYAPQTVPSELEADVLAVLRTKAS